MHRIFRTCVSAASLALCLAQQHGVVHVEVRAGGQPVSQAQVVIKDRAYKVDQLGTASIDVAPGPVEMTIVSEGYLTANASLSAEPGLEQRVVVDLQKPPELAEEVIVSSTRTDKRIEDQPTKVEVLSREEIEEKMVMTPGDIVMMLNEMGGLRVQATSPSLGAANVRIQGMRGRYTRVLLDGLPLFGQQTGGIGLLQIPPMDLGQVEVIKGVASALYGAGALGGVVNLISRRPGPKPLREVLINETTRGGTDTVFFLTSPMAPRLSLSLLGGGHWQRETDVGGDGWADLPGYSRGVLRPRLFWDSGNGRNLFVTTGITYEDRKGGTVAGSVLPTTGAPYEEALKTFRFDVGAVGQILYRDRYLLTMRFAAARQAHDHQFGEVLERDEHGTLFSEIAVRGSVRRQTWVAGLALDRESYDPRDVPRFRYTHNVPGVFAQDDVEIKRWLTLSVSGRLDVHSQYGTFFSPRLSTLLRGRGWVSRLSLGEGFFAPTPLTEETEAAGLLRLVIPAKLKPELGRSGSLDLTRSAGPGSYTVTLFASKIHRPIHVERSGGYVLTNLPEPTTNVGVELLGTFRPRHFSVTGAYTYVRSRELDEGRKGDIPLTPRHSAGLTGMWESEKSGRIGVEVYYTGQQGLDANPFQISSRPYVLVGFLIERRFGPVRAFLNAENLTGVRQTRWDPLLRPTRAVDGRWTVDAWAPLDGRIFNGGLRVEF